MQSAYSPMVRHGSYKAVKKVRFLLRALILLYIIDLPKLKYCKSCGKHVKELGEHGYCFSCEGKKNDAY